MKTFQTLALSALIIATGCSSKAHDKAAAQAHQVALDGAINAVRYAVQQQYLDQQPYSLKAGLALCGGTPDECARQAFIKASDDRMRLAEARIDCISLGGTPDECD